ncbi:MAG TPA: DUF4843 domain-containing protein [Chitinophagaceae bacterium]
MKKTNIYLILVAFTLSFAGCKEDVPTLFTEPDGIYFSASSDSISYTFAKYPSRLIDTLKIPVTVLGTASEVDREMFIEKGAGSDVNATEGVHYKLLPPYKMPAGKVSTTIPVAVYRTGDMDSITATFILQLKANENFQSGISTKTSLKVKLGYLQKPPTWGEYTGLQWAGYSANFGSWTKTKYKIILETLYDPVSDTTVTEFPYARTGAPAIYLQYAQLVRNHLRTNYPGNFSIPRGIGATLRDPDYKDSVIQVFPANY